jgi:RHS repeat-associated protein
MAAKARSILLLLAACCSLFAHIPRTSSVGQNSHPGLEPFALPSHPAPPAVNSLIATGFCECLYDEGKRSRSTGKERDAETGLDYFGARYLSSAQGRFTSPDVPFAAQRPERPQTWNLYSYARNNPLFFTDPTGRQEAGPTCGGDQQCLDRVNESTTKVVKGFLKGIVNGFADFLDFASCPVCKPHGDVLPAEGPEETLGNVAGQVATAGAVSKGVGALAEVVTLPTETVTLFRAVQPAELAQIVKTGGFSNPPGIEVKYFSTTAEGAQKYGAQAAKAFGDGPYTVVQTSVPKVAMTPQMQVVVDRGIPAVTVPTKVLPQLSRPKVVK